MQQENELKTVPRLHTVSVGDNKQQGASYRYEKMFERGIKGSFLSKRSCKEIKSEHIDLNIPYGFAQFD